MTRPRVGLLVSAVGRFCYKERVSSFIYDIAYGLTKVFVLLNAGLSDSEIQRLEILWAEMSW